MIELLNIDCMEYMKGCEDDAFDLAIVDPPYGSNALDGSKVARKYGVNRLENWDCARPDKKYFKEINRTSKNQIIFGANYYLDLLRPTKGFIIYDKQHIPDEFKTMSPVELAWSSFDRPAKIFRANGNEQRRIHPTQKPVKLYDWLLANYAKPGQRILDTHLGSGSSAIAAHYFGCDFVGCEIDSEYHAAAVKRFERETAQVDMFSA